MSQVVGQRIDERARIVAVAGVDDHARRLVHDEQVGAKKRGFLKE